LDRLAKGDKVKVVFNVFGDEDKRGYLEELKRRGIVYRNR
jgi:hypothetical protein